MTADPEVVARLRAAGCVYAEDEARLLADAAGSPAELAALLARRVAGEPLEPLLGWAGFCGLRVAVQPGVFVPRRRTELLARRAMRLCPPGGVLVDLCCGSGAVAFAVAGSRPDVEVHAADVDPVAVRCAAANLAGRGQVHAGDLYAALPASLRGRIDVLAVNAPYVPTPELATMPAEAREHEPRVALDGGGDGLDVQQRVTAAAEQWLAPGGHLLIETSLRQAPATAAAFAGGGLTAEVERDEDLDATIVVGTVRTER